MALAIIGLGTLFFLGHGLNWFFTKTKIPDLLILVILGYVMGPTLGILNADDFGKVGGVISALALIVILYEGGLTLSAKDLLTSSLPAAALSLVGFGLSVLIGIIVAYGMALEPLSVALLIGVGIGSTSSAIVMPMVKFLSIDQKTKTILSLESAFTDVLTIVIFLVLVDAFAQGQFEVKQLAMGLGPNTLVAGAIGMGSAFLWAFAKKRFTDVLPKAFAGEAWALLTYGGLEFLGYNGAIGVLALGFTLANLNLLPQWITNFISNKPVTMKEMSLLKEITFLLRTFFFIYLGLLIQFGNWKIVVFALVICILIVISRYLMVRIILRPAKYALLDAMVSTAMGPRGLACAVLATLPLQKGIEGGAFIQSTLFAVIPFSILFTAIFVAISEKEGCRKKFIKVFSGYQETSPGPLELSTEESDLATLEKPDFKPIKD